MTNMRATIISVAIDLFYKRGYFATSISEIAKGCGIRKASIYYHFAGKEELLFSIMKSTMEDLSNDLQTNLRENDDVEMRIRAAVRGHVRFHLKHQKETFIASSELRGLSPLRLSEIVSMRDQYESVFQELIYEGHKQGIFVVEDIKILSYAILTLCTAGASWFNANGRLTIDKIAAIYENFILSGLRISGK